jgi:hypothetical protein
MTDRAIRRALARDRKDSEWMRAAAIMRRVMREGV